jgi:1-acyl-sn-glycerol-3-phosphate acyltransferase
LAIYGHLPIDFRWVMKMELRKVPIIGGGCARIQHVYIDRSDPEKAIASLKAARTQLVNGTSIVFFPEGTRSRTDQMLPFKKGAFRMAVDLQLPVLPITLRNTGQLMRKWGFEAKPGTIDMVIHPPIPVDDLCDDDVPKLMQQAREVIQSGIDRPFPSL